MNIDTYPVPLQTWTDPLFKVRAFAEWCEHAQIEFTKFMNALTAGIELADAAPTTQNAIKQAMEDVYPSTFNNHDIVVIVGEGVTTVRELYEAFSLRDYYLSIENVEYVDFLSNEFYDVYDAIGGNVVKSYRLYEVESLIKQHYHALVVETGGAKAAVMGANVADRVSVLRNYVERFVPEASTEESGYYQVLSDYIMKDRDTSRYVDDILDIQQISDIKDGLAIGNSDLGKYLGLIPLTSLLPDINITINAVSVIEAIDAVFSVLEVIGFGIGTIIGRYFAGLVNTYEAPQDALLKEVNNLKEVDFTFDCCTEHGTFNYGDFISGAACQPVAIPSYQLEQLFPHNSSIRMSLLTCDIVLIKQNSWTLDSVVDYYIKWKPIKVPVKTSIDTQTTFNRVSGYPRTAFKVRWASSFDELGNELSPMVAFDNTFNFYGLNKWSLDFYNKIPRSEIYYGNSDRESLKTYDNAPSSIYLSGSNLWDSMIACGIVNSAILTQAIVISSASLLEAEVYDYQMFGSSLFNDVPNVLFWPYNQNQVGSSQLHNFTNYDIASCLYNGNSVAHEILSAANSSYDSQYKWATGNDNVCWLAVLLHTLIHTMIKRKQSIDVPFIPYTTGELFGANDQYTLATDADNIATARVRAGLIAGAIAGIALIGTSVKAFRRAQARADVKSTNLRLTLSDKISQGDKLSNAELNRMAKANRRNAFLNNTATTSNGILGAVVSATTNNNKELNSVKDNSQRIIDLITD